MSDFPIAVPDRRGPGRQPQRGEHLWTLKKDSSILRCELRSHGSLGVELQIIRDGTLIYTRWYPDHEITVKEAAEQREFFERDSWTFTSE